MTTAHKDLDFDTPEGRARLVARALRSPSSIEYHDDVPDGEFPSEDMLTSALLVLMPLFGSIRVPEHLDGELGGVLLTVTPVSHIAITIYPPAMGEPDGGSSLALYKPPGVTTDTAISRLAHALSMLNKMRADDDAPASGSVH